MDAIKILHYTYIIRSLSSGIYYIGSTKNLEDRLRRHNQGGSTFTKPHKPFEIVYSRGFATKSEAVKYEMKLKSFKSRIQLEQLIAEQNKGAANRTP
jgi:putative endonuclease